MSASSTPRATSPAASPAASPAISPRSQVHSPETFIDLTDDNDDDEPLQPYKRTRRATTDLEARMCEIARFRDLLQEKENEILAKDEALAQRDQIIALKDIEIQDKDETAAQKDLEIQFKNGTVAQMDKEIMEHLRIIGDKDRAINSDYKEDYYAGVHQPNHDHCCRSTWCTNREVLIDQHDDQVERLENMINDTISEKNNIIRDLREKIEELENRL